MPVILYGLELSPPCLAVLLTAKQIGLDIDLKHVNILTGEDNKSEVYLKMNPAHSIPTLDDDGFHIWESRAILGYLVQQYAKDDELYPKEPKQRALVDNILHFDNGALYASFAQYFYPQAFYDEKPSTGAEEKVADRLSILNEILSRYPFAAGSKLTIADISLVCSLSILPAFDYSLVAYPNILKYLAKVKASMPFYDQVTKLGIDHFASLVKGKLEK